ncbi:MAG: GNAT family N-acetyltransferase [Lentisphaeria bacterium]|nr:GNAT family N-acetyltransferase [Lentisphaeria bacterium]
MEYRRAVPADAPLLAALRLDMRRERETAPPPADMEAFANEVAAYFRAALADGSFAGIIAEEGGEAAGTGGICFHHHPPSYAVPNGRTACLLNMYTVPKFRGRGVASGILRKLREIAVEAGCCKMTLNASAAGKPLYVKFGFTEVANEMELVLIGRSGK